MDWEALGGLFGETAAGEGWLERLRRHWALTRERPEAGRLTAVEDEEEAVRRHYAESLELVRLAEEAGIGRAGVRYGDVGTGGGWPGLAVACVRPGWEVHLVEPLGKRAAFLAGAAAELGLANVTVHCVRAEEAGRGPLRGACDLVTARAVAELRVLLEYTAPLARVGGLVLLPKGSRLEDELSAAEAALEALGCRVEGIVPMRREVSGEVRVVAVRKLGETPAGYPRRPGVAERRPLGGPAPKNR